MKAPPLLGLATLLLITVADLSDRSGATLVRSGGAAIDR
jgi:hypothetical protein